MDAYEEMTDEEPMATMLRQIKEIDAGTFKGMGGERLRESNATYLISHGIEVPDSPYEVAKAKAVAEIRELNRKAAEQ